MEPWSEYIRILHGKIPIPGGKARRLGKLDVCNLYVSTTGGAADGVDGVPGFYIALFTERSLAEVDGFALVDAPIYSSGNRTPEPSSSESLSTSTSAFLVLRFFWFLFTLFPSNILLFFFHLMIYHFM